MRAKTTEQSDDPEPNLPQKTPKDQANFFSLLTFWWLGKLLRQGYKRTLCGDDLPPLPNEDRTETLVKALEKEWILEVQSSRHRGTRPKLWRSVLKIVPWRDYLVMISLRFLYSVAFLAVPLILWFLLRALSLTSGVDRKMVVSFIAALGLAAIVKPLCTHYSFYVASIWTIRVKVAIVGLIYKKVTIQLLVDKHFRFRLMIFICRFFVSL